MKLSRILAVIPVVGLLLAVQCGSDKPPVGDAFDAGGPPVTGPCTTNGETRDCHAVVGQGSGYVDCFNGTQTCENGQWSPCDGSGTSKGKHTIRPFVGGLTPLSLSSPSNTTPPCSLDPCNPYCWGFNETPPSPIAPPPGCMITLPSGGSCGMGKIEANTGGYSSLPAADQVNLTSCISSTAACPTTLNVVDATPNCDGCQYDTHCSGGTCAQWGAGGYNAAAGGVDLTLGYQCLDVPATGSTYHFPVCNRGSTTLSGTGPTIHIGLYVSINFTTGAPKRSQCVAPASPSPPDDKEVIYPLTGQPFSIAPGQCVDVNATNSTFTGAAGDLIHVGERVAVNWNASVTEVNYCNNWNMEDDAACSCTPDGTGCITTVSGTVYDPSATLPLPNIEVYQPSAPLISYPAGVGCDTCTTLTTPYLNIAASGPDGSFTLPIDTSSGTTNIPIVVQTGRWRREFTIPSVTACTNNTIAAGTARLPRNHDEGTIPYTAIAMAGAESLECLLVKLGISTSGVSVSGSEFGPYPTAGASFQLVKNGSGQMTVAGAPYESAIFGTALNLNAFNSVLLPCGAGSDGTSSSANGAGSATSLGNIKSWVNNGGRMFIDHVPGETIINSATTGWNGTANGALPGCFVWASGGGCNITAPSQGLLLTTSPEATALENWMALPAVGGTATYGAPYFQVPTPRDDVTTVHAPAVEWARGEDTNGWGGTPAGDYTLTYSFDANTSGLQGFGAGCGRVVFNDMHVSATRGSLGNPFPAQCDTTTPLNEAELALAYMLFQATACQGGAPPPPPPPPSIGPPPMPVNYTNTYTMATCPPGTCGTWDSFSYNVYTPAGSDIKFAVQTGPAPVGPWTPTTGTPAGVLIADAPVDHPGGDMTGNTSCTMTGPSPCGNNCAPYFGPNTSAACPLLPTGATCQCPINVTTPLQNAGVDPTQPDLQLNVLITPSALSCAGVLSPGLLAQPNGVSTCSGAHNINGTTCTAATQYSACDQDYHCDLVVGSPTYGQCIYNLNPPWIDPGCAIGSQLGFDLTIGSPCTDATGTIVTIPVCNRGGATIPAGQVIQITRDVYASGCAQACSATGASPYGFTADCNYTLAAPLAAGSCVNIPSSAGCNLGSGEQCLQVNPGNTVVDVNGNKECNTAAHGGIWPVNGTGAGCYNNDTYAKNTPAGCQDTCNPPLSGGVPSLSAWNVTYSCVPCQ